MGKRPDDRKTVLEKPWKRQRNWQAQVYEEIFSSEISSVLRHWERRGDLELRADLQVYENWKDRDEKKSKEYNRGGSTPPPPLPPRSNALMHRVACQQVLEVDNLGGHRTNSSGGLPIMRGNNEKNSIAVNNSRMNHNACKKQKTITCYPKPRLQMHKKKGFARKKIRFVV